MNLNFNISLAAKYHSGTQIARVLTESWVVNHMYCPRCGNLHIKHFPNNRPVADFYCPHCKCEYELKSKSGSLGRKINDGAYDTMIQRILSNQNPDFFFMSYTKDEFKVKELILIPKHFFLPEIIEKRNPLNKNARRAGWVGCNILLHQIPEQGRISIVSNGVPAKMNMVVEKVNKSNTLILNDINARGWLMDVLKCVNETPAQVFSLEDIYRFEDDLHRKHSKNNHIKSKIRQQLQILRDKGFVEFLGNGTYRKSS